MYNEKPSSIISLIRGDLYRYTGNISFNQFIHYFRYYPEFKYLCIFRLSQMKVRIFRSFFLRLLQYYKIKYAIQIPSDTQIGKGFHLLHFGNIVINDAAVIGNNCTVAQGALIGASPDSNSVYGAPTIGNNVFIGANAIVISKIKIGDYCLIAPGAFVNRDMPPHTIAIGNPATFHYKKCASNRFISYPIEP